MTAAPRKRVPANAPKPQDHKPKTSAQARKAEAEGVVVIEHNGLALRIDLNNPPIKALLRLQGLKDDLTEFSEDERPLANLQGSMELLGPEQWSALLAKNPGVRDFAEISGKLSEALAGSGN
ncbi:hypothetical protein [Mycobacteroides abscessus]|uniref:hypothetical protein n=1 Tax=Mycobacteroides abscessus TaxID=36809 RepID=UPI00092B8D30|nr:hypothetical protein [Mycobacteroides abscessus]SIH58732.1 Uncharacterised protein [Mycobacteroides abscessus subsp. abscessus]SIN52567.1 Uncharacterised protein [Mycobacteroides abscessus subsp. abscessus]SLI57137.1 Uncharacterised protein [Mycobacteroides abscessus subsp. abscessus]